MISNDLREKAEKIEAEWVDSDSISWKEDAIKAIAQALQEVREETIDDRDKWLAKAANFENERDLAREMLISDRTHASCGVFQNKQEKKISRLEEDFRIMREIARVLSHTTPSHDIGNPCDCNKWIDQEFTRRRGEK